MNFTPVKCPTCDRIINQYRGVPPNPLVTIEALRCRQKGKIYFLTDVPADELDAMTTVPRFDWGLSYKDMAEKILSTGLTATQIEAWQRDLLKDNLENIASFWENPRNNIVNCAVIALKEDTQRPIEQDGHIQWIPVEVRESSPQRFGSKELVKIEIDSWFSCVCPDGHRLPAEGGADIYFDTCPEEDCYYHRHPWRPALIIDGQHRIKGTQLPPSLGSTKNPGVNKELLPVAILGPSSVTDATPFTQTDQAKIFTEISAKAIALDPLHRLFLFYVFNTGVHKEDMFLPPPPKVNPLRNAYETILRLCSSSIPLNPLTDRIKVLKPRRGAIRTSSLNFDRALREWFEKWFKPKGIWHHTTTQDAAKEIVEFIQAIRIVWPGTSPISPTLYWQTAPPPNPRGIFSHGTGGDMSAFLRVLFDLYPLIYSNVTTHTKQAFAKFLRKKLKDASSDIGIAHWDGAGWDAIRSPDKNYSLLKIVLENIFQGTDKVEYDIKNMPQKPPDINAYLNLDPSIYEVKVLRKNVVHKQTIKVAVLAPQIKIKFRLPILSRGTVVVEVRENGNITWGPMPVEVKRGEKNTFTLSQLLNHYSGQPGTRVRVEIRANSHNIQDEPFTFFLEF